MYKLYMPYNIDTMMPLSLGKYMKYNISAFEFWKTHPLIRDSNQNNNFRNEYLNKFWPYATTKYVQLIMGVRDPQFIQCARCIFIDGA